MTRICLFSLCLVLLSLGVRESSGQVVLNEILADPASDWSGDSTYSYRDDEWVEIYNAGTTPIDLSPYWVGDADSTLLYNFSGVLHARRHRVVYGAEVVEWQRANGRSAVGLRLNNSGDTVMLWTVEPGSLVASACPATLEVAPVDAAFTDATRSDPANVFRSSAAAGLQFASQGAGVVLIDSYTYLSHEAEDDRSSGRMPDGGSVWHLFDGRNPYGGSQEPQGSGCLPSPGAQNGCPTPTSQRSWGSVKAIYRQ